MEKQVTIMVPNAAGEEGLTRACKRGDLFRNNEKIERYYRQGYAIHHYDIVDVKRDEQGERTEVKVTLER
jgi:hypothetical protein